MQPIRNTISQQKKAAERKAIHKFVTALGNAVIFVGIAIKKELRGSCDAGGFKVAVDEMLNAVEDMRAKEDSDAR